MDVKKLAIEIAKKHGTHDPFMVAEARNINILNCPMKSTFGYYTKYRRVQNIILNCNMADEFRKFVCAHELGHAICHPDINTQWLTKNTLFSVDKVERQASAFAVELLLPDNFLQEHNGCSMYCIARELGIPSKLIQLKTFT